MVVGDPVPLDILTAGGEIIVGDKTFTDFTYAKTEDMPSAAGVNVIPIKDDDGNYGLRFQAAFIDLPGGDPSDALITFSASVTDGVDMQISDVHLAANTNLNGPGLAEVTETFLPQSTVLKLNVFDSPNGTKLADWADLPEPVSKLSVQKDIALRADEGAISASVSFVDQTFSQVPEPAYLGLLLLSIAGVLLHRR